jgi:hypothetical protein
MRSCARVLPAAAPYAVPLAPLGHRLKADAVLPHQSSCPISLELGPSANHYSSAAVQSLCHDASFSVAKNAAPWHFRTAHLGIEPEPSSGSTVQASGDRLERLARQPRRSAGVQRLNFRALKPGHVWLDVVPKLSLQVG